MRTTIIRERTREIQRLEKLMEDTGVKLSSVASAMHGVSVRIMLDALVAASATWLFLPTLPRADYETRFPS
jgi:hypothetical protein